MLKNKKNDLLYLLNILEYTEKIFLYSKFAGDPESFYNSNDQLNYNAVLNLLTQIGENCGKISDDTKNEHSYSWEKIIGLRNRIAHDYSGINVFIVFDTIRNSLPGLKNQIIKILREALNASVFDNTELESAKQSRFYAHVDFSDFLS